MPTGISELVLRGRREWVASIFAAVDRDEKSTAAERRAAMTWAQRLKRVFGIDIETCASCGGVVRIVACIEDPDLIEKILAHLDGKAPASTRSQLPPSRSSPQLGLFD